MTDVLRERLERIRASTESARRRAGLYSEIAGMDDRGTVRSLGALHKASAPGKKLQKIGFIMLWVPEPTGVTCAVGAPMILAGRYLDKKYNGSTIGDIGRQAKATGSDIRDFKNTIM